MLEIGYILIINIPHFNAVIMLTKLSSKRIIPADSLATSVPAIPKKKPLNNL
jgi:hypothetical protein